jgi:hypothetical protein
VEVLISDISSGELNNFLPLSCSFCGMGFRMRKDEEGKDFFFQRNDSTGEEWCICFECRELNKLDRKNKNNVNTAE